MLVGKVGPTQGVISNLLYTLGTSALGVGLLGLTYEVVINGPLREFRNLTELTKIDQAACRIVHSVLADSELMAEVGRSTAVFSFDRRLREKIGHETSADYLVQKLTDQLELSETRDNLRIDFALEHQVSQASLSQEYWTSARPGKALRFVLRIFRNQQQIIPLPVRSDYWVYDYIVPPGEDPAGARDMFRVPRFSIGDVETANIPHATVTEYPEYDEAVIEFLPPIPRIADRYKITFQVLLPQPGPGEYAYFAASAYTRAARISCDSANTVGLDVTVIDLLRSFATRRIDRELTARVKGVETAGWIDPEAAVVFAVGRRT